MRAILSAMQKRQSSCTGGAFWSGSASYSKTKGRLMPTGASLHIGLNAVDPKHYSGWDGQLTACEFDANDGNASHGYWKIRNRAINVCPFTPVTAPRFQITTVTKSLITLTRHLCRSISTGTTGPLTRLTIISTIYTRSSHTKLH